MITPPVTMRYAELPVRDAVAIVIPGDDAGMWFQQLTAAGLDPSAAQYLLIPEPGSLKTAAAVVIPATADFRNLSAEYIRYGRVGARLYAPVHAVFFRRSGTRNGTNCFQTWNRALCGIPIGD